MFSPGFRTTPVCGYQIPYSLGTTLQHYRLLYAQVRGSTQGLDTPFRLDPRYDNDRPRCVKYSTPQAPKKRPEKISPERPPHLGVVGRGHSRNFSCSLPNFVIITPEFSYVHSRIFIYISLPNFLLPPGISAEFPVKLLFMACLVIGPEVSVV